MPATTSPRTGRFAVLTCRGFAVIKKNPEVAEVLGTGPGAGSQRVLGAQRLAEANAAGPFCAHGAAGVNQSATLAVYR